MAAGIVLKSTTCMMLVAVVLAAWAVPQSEAIGCGTVVGYLNPCVPYLTGKGPLGGCCGGVKGLYKAASSPADKQSVCSCLKSLAASYSGVNTGKASGLPGQCGVSIPYKISPNTDCSKIQ